MYFLIFVFFALAVPTNIIAAHYTKKKAEISLPNPYSPLPDIIHSTFPPIPTLSPDYFLLCCICFALHNYKYLVDIQIHSLCTGACLLIRSVSVCLTITPTCMPKSLTSNTYSKLFVSTHDLMFSGHSLVFIAIGYVLNNIFVQLLGPLLLVISRQHYTIDVCVSALVYQVVLTWILSLA